MASPVLVTVSDVRREIYRAAGRRVSDSAASTAWLGTLFHDVFRRLMEPGFADCWLNVLDADSLKHHQKLREHAWLRIVGPKLRQNQAALQRSAREVLNFWEAVGHMCQHIRRL